MGGGGGTSGAVEFPDYIQDTHGQMMVGVSVDEGGEYSNPPSFDLGTGNHLFRYMDSQLSNDPYNYTFTDPQNAFDETDTQFDDFYSFVTGVSTTSIEELVSAALKSVNVGDWTSDLEDVEFTTSLPTASQEDLTFSTSALSTSLGVLTSAYDEITSLVPDASTPDWEVSIQDAADKLRECGIVEEAELEDILGEAAMQTEYILEDAIGIAEQIANRQEITDLVNDFASRREDSFQREVSRFNAQMADVNAINSSAYMVGLSLLKAEHSRQEASFDKEITFRAFNNAIDHYVQSYVTQLQTLAELEASNAQQYNQLLSQSVQAILEIKIRDWNRGEKISETELLNLFANVFNAELQAALSTGELRLNLAQLNSSIEQFNAEQKREEERLGLEADRINKTSREQRFLQSLQATLNLLTNRAEFEKVASELKTEQKRIRLAGTHEYETLELDTEVKDAMWELQILDTGAQILAAPSGMARRLPEGESKTASAIGGGLKGAATGAQVGASIGGHWGAGIGAVIGGTAGAISGAQ